MSPLRLWVSAARPRTLPAAVAPVLVGTALAVSEGALRPLAFACALVGSVFIQIGTNLSNDYSDARRGADTDDRLGPVRVTAGGLMPPRQVLVGTYLAFGVAVLAGVYLIAVAGIELLIVGVVSILAGVLYTGAAPLRVRGARRAVRVPVLRRGRGDRLVLRADRATVARCPRPVGSRSACWRRRSSSSTTCATWTPTAARASARWR
ncbi:MAG: 1,4-dihydroxy-2-naphthoate octaprenyltransferase [Thermoleophilaceae bacterium]